MILSTTPTLEGKTIREYRGIVVGEAILGANVFKDLFAGIRDIIGGRSGAYEKELARAREIAFDELKERAAALGGQYGGRHRHRLRGGGAKRQHADGQHQRHRRAGLSLRSPCFGKGR